MLDTFENISLKITYEFSTFTTEQLVELINYEGRLATLGSFSVSAGPQLTVFESTSKYSINTMHLTFKSYAIIIIRY